jgi:hypothetical protein
MVFSLRFKKYLFLYAGIFISTAETLCSGAPMPTPFSITSTSFQNNTPIPAKHACKQHIAPEFSLHNVPAGTQSLVLVIDDPDAQRVAGHTFVHLIAQLDPKTTTIPEGKLDTLVRQYVTNDAGQEPYSGPCPPENTGTHHYYFTILALDKPLDLEKYKVEDFRDTWDKSSPFCIDNQKSIIGTAQIMGTFER